MPARTWEVSVSPSVVPRYLSNLAREAEMEVARVSETEWERRIVLRADRIVVVLMGVRAVLCVVGVVAAVVALAEV